MESKITKIVIKTQSGYGPAENAYNDKMVVTNDSVSYEYKPFLETEKNPMVKWNYKPTQETYQDLYQKIGKVAESYFNKQFDYCVMDVGVTGITIVYENGKKKSENFCCFESEFKELFLLLDRLIPVNRLYPDKKG